MEQLGVIGRIEEPTGWCSGMVMAPKKTKDEVRICMDLTPLNEVVCREKFILPSVDQTHGMLGGAQLFTKLDANMGFWQIPLAKDSALSITFITLPFGSASVPEHFQNRIVTKVRWGSSEEEHSVRLHAVLERAQKAGITLNTEKCEFGKREGMRPDPGIISTEGMRPDPDKTRAVQQREQPTNTSEFRSFLGMVYQLPKFITEI